MEKVLSQEEVDSLLEGINEGKVETETDIPEEDERLKAYDFSRQDGPLHIRMPALGIINERFVGFLRTSLSAATKSLIDVNLSSTESVKFGEFSRSLLLPTSLNIFKMEPLRGLALLVLEGPLVFSFVDTLFGGKGESHVKLEGRPFTTVERMIIEKIVKVILGDLQRAWADVYRVKMVFTRSEMDPQFAAVVTPDETVVLINLTVELECASGGMTVCIPYSTIEPIREKLKYRFQGEELEVDQTWRRYLERKIRDLRVDLSATLGKTKITGRALLEMKIDDVIQLDQKTSNPVTLSVEGITKFKAYPGTVNNKKAIRIEERVSEE